MKKEAYVDFAISYKKRVTNSFIPLSAGDIGTKVSGSRFYVSRKYDGQLALLFYDGNTVSAFGSKGSPIPELPVFDNAADALKTAKLKDACIAAELYVDEKDGRKRVGDVRKAIVDKNASADLRLAPFDLIELDSIPYKAANWSDTHKELARIFGKTADCLPVQMEEAASKAEAQNIFSRWVEKEGAEGIVVRSELPIVYKIKPLYTIDAAVIGFTESEIKGRVRALLFALMNEDGSFQVIAHAGNGLDEDSRASLFAELSKKTVASTFIQTDSNHVAFRMIKPEKAAEISALDLTNESSYGPITNPCLVFEKDSYHSIGSVSGVSLISPVFLRWRDDKTVNPTDLRLAQIQDFLGETKSSKAEKLKPSEMLRREVYKKESGGKLMVQKFLLWKTNKEQDNLKYPAYVFSNINFSSGRADAFQTDIRVTNDEKQAGDFFDAFVAENIKKGWDKC
jgi:ATP-dependent DNA ligase